MQIEVFLDGQKYVSEESDEATAEQIKDAIYKNLESLNKFQMKLDDGGYLLLPPGAATNAVIVIRDQR